jgi:hypothetical protein
MDSSTRRVGADTLSKDVAKNGTPIDYFLQFKDAYRKIEETQWDGWNHLYVCTAENGRAYCDAIPDPWYNNTSIDAHKHTKLAGKNGSSKIWEFTIFHTPVQNLTEEGYHG